MKTQFMDLPAARCADGYELIWGEECARGENDEWVAYKWTCNPLGATPQQRNCQLPPGVHPLIRTFARGLRHYFIDAGEQLLAGPGQRCRWQSKLNRWHAILKPYIERDASHDRYPTRQDWYQFKDFDTSVQDLKDLVAERDRFKQTILCSGTRTQHGFMNMWEEKLKVYPVSDDWLNTDGNWDEEMLGVDMFSEWIPPWDTNRRRRSTKCGNKRSVSSYVPNYTTHAKTTTLVTSTTQDQTTVVTSTTHGQSATTAEEAQTTAFTGMMTSTSQTPARSNCMEALIVAAILFAMFLC